MTETKVYNKNNLIIGWCRDFGDRVTGTHLTKGYVGAYIKATNITVDKYGKIYCYGDGVSSLIRDADR